MIEAASGLVRIGSYTEMRDMVGTAGATADCHSSRRPGSQDRPVTQDALLLPGDGALLGTAQSTTDCNVHWTTELTLPSGISFLSDK
jgi:hypothetical protein